MTVSSPRLNREGRRVNSSWPERSDGDVAEAEAIKVCERCALCGGARGPPGAEGGVPLALLLDRWNCALVWLPVRTGGLTATEMGFEIVGRNLSLRPLDMLALRPSDAKKPPLSDGVGASERMDAVAVALLALDCERVGRVLAGGGFSAREGYGRSGGIPVGVMSRYAPCRRSVATEASGRMGKVASEIMDEREVWRGCGVNGCVDGPR